MSVRHTKGSLAKVNVEIIDEDRYWLECKFCGGVWSPNYPPLGQRFAKGWWKCPYYGCNDVEIESKSSDN